MMRCVHCGFNLPDEDTVCSNCHKPVSEVSVLSPQEREAFDGVTIDQDTDQRDNKTNQQNQQRVHIRRVYIGGNNSLSGFLTLLAVGFIAAVILFFAVPAILLLVAAAVVFWGIKRIFF